MELLNSIAHREFLHRRPESCLQQGHSLVSLLPKEIPLAQPISQRPRERLLDFGKV